MVIACIVGIVIVLVVAFVYSSLSVSKKSDREYEQLKKEILEEMKNSGDEKG